MNSLYRKALSPSPAQSQVDFFDTRAAVEALKPGAYQTLPYIYGTYSGRKLSAPLPAGAIERKSAANYRA